MLSQHIKASVDWSLTVKSLILSALNTITKIANRARKPIIYWNGIQPICSLDLIRGIRKRRYQILHQSLQNQDTLCGN
jgi:hypothetical protein